VNETIELEETVKIKNAMCFYHKGCKGFSLVFLRTFVVNDFVSPQRHNIFMDQMRVLILQTNEMVVDRIRFGAIGG